MIYGAVTRKALSSYIDLVTAPGLRFAAWTYFKQKIPGFSYTLKVYRLSRDSIAKPMSLMVYWEQRHAS